MNHKPKILLVDDETLVREELGGILQDEGYDVITGADGEEGLALFRSANPDFVITDVRMPRRDGLSLAMTIRQENASVPVTVITGHGTESMAIEALRAGVTDFIKKPVRLDGLTAALHRMEVARRPLDLGFDELPKAVELVHCVWTYRLRNDLSAIPAFSEMLLRKISEGMDRSAAQELGLALRELLINAIEHGNLGLSYEEKSHAMEEGTLEQLLQERAKRPEYKDRQVTIAARREDRRLVVTITDQGKGFDWQSLPDPTDVANLLSTHGRGVLLARLSVDSLEYSGNGSAVTVSKGF